MLQERQTTLGVGKIEGIIDRLAVPELVKSVLLFYNTKIAYLSVQIGRLATKFSSYVEIPFDTETILETLLVGLAQRIFPQISKTFVLELNVARLRNELAGATSEERFNSFIVNLSARQGLDAIFQEYPVLANRLELTFSQWFNYSLEFLTHLIEDWPSLCLTFSPTNLNPGRLVEIQAQAGDVHQAGRSVLKLRFESGFRLVYKPRSLALDYHFQQLLAWLNKRGASPAFPVLKVLDCPNYGWMEFVEARQEVSSATQVERFYERQGGYLALLYLLDATDFHFENIIACGEYPLLVDLEALFQPHLPSPLSADFSDPARLGLEYSVLRTGLLPRWHWQNADLQGLDISGLGASREQLLAQPQAAWQAANTDEMYLGQGNFTISPGQNLPKLGGEGVDSQNYTSSLVTGFQHTYNLLQKHKDELLSAATPLAALARLPVRFIPRHTQVYARILEESYHPDLQRQVSANEAFLQGQLAHQTAFPSELLATELADLASGNIPYFTVYPAATAIYGASGELCTASFLTQPAWEVVKARLRNFGEPDLLRQVWQIKAAFACDPHLPATATAPHKPIQDSAQPHNLDYSERALKLAIQVGDYLTKLAWEDTAGRVSWLNLSQIRSGQSWRWAVVPADLSLYNGLPGIVLFLAQLGALTGNSPYTSLARKCLATIKQLCTRQAGKSLERIGFFDGIGGLIYLYTELARLWNEPALLQEAFELAQQIPERIAQDKVYDVVGGSSGAILSLLNLYNYLHEETLLVTAQQCSEHLISQAIRPNPSSAELAWATQPDNPTRPVTGFAHGTSGIALSLLKLAEKTGAFISELAACCALEYERNNFPYFKAASSSDKNSNTDALSNSWCYGTVGFGLSRLAVQSYLAGKLDFKSEIEAALQTNIVAGPEANSNDSLCHGALGSLDLLLVAQQFQTDFAYTTELTAFSSKLLAAIENSGMDFPNPANLEEFGLMTGLTGLGYQMLRLAAPHQIPSILLLGQGC